MVRVIGESMHTVNSISVTLLSTEGAYNSDCVHMLYIHSHISAVTISEFWVDGSDTIYGTPRDIYNNNLYTHLSLFRCCLYGGVYVWDGVHTVGVKDSM